MGKFAAIGAAILGSSAAAGASAATLATIGAVGTGVAGYAASKLLSGGGQQDSSAEAATIAANAQKEIAANQLAAVKESEKEAQTTAQSKLRLAQARKSQTILTGPELEDVNVNQRTALGV